jgi:hypothetical protein
MAEHNCFKVVFLSYLQHVHDVIARFALAENGIESGIVDVAKALGIVELSVQDVGNDGEPLRLSCPATERKFNQYGSQYLLESHNSLLGEVN